jgi:hypothetical protein
MIRYIAAVAAVFFILTPAPATQPTVYVILWFDTEDYILPASDDAALKVADWLTKEGIKATFKVVGEKARTLERRRRQDVIDALKKHEIGYHSNYHSVQPTPAQYLAPLGWDEGVAEFDRREKSGYDDVKRIFGQAPSCYGQPGSSWGPQSYGAMRKWGVPVYLDAGSHVKLDGKPHYYGGVLTLYNLTYTLRTNLDGEKSLKQAEDRFTEARKKLLAEGGGIVSIYYHPCEFVHKQFWDGANFAKGANPPREKWKLPEAKTEVESRVAYETFFNYIQFIKRFADVKFITAREAAEIYRDEAVGREFTAKELDPMASKARLVVTGSHGPGESLTLAPSEVLYLFNSYMLKKTFGIKGSIKLASTPLGPTGAGPAMPKPVTVDINQFLESAADVLHSMESHGRVPTTVWFGSTGVTPEAYFLAVARVLRVMIDEGRHPEQIELTPAKLFESKYVADDDPKLWGWVIFPPEFKSAPDMMALAKRQAWTIKPAVLHGPK